MAGLKRRLEQHQEKLVEEWNQRLKAARSARRAFDLIGDQCHSFYARGCGHMWTPDFMGTYVGKDVTEPMFKVTVNKTFEYVTIVGPHLFWGNPQVTLTPMQPLDFDIAAIGDPEDPEVQQIYQQLTTEQSMNFAKVKLQSDLMTRVVNYLNREQYCNLAKEGMFSLIDGMVRGMGCLWHEEYSFPGSPRKFVGAFFDSVKNLWVDPDCTEPSWKSAKYIIRRRFSTPYDLEKRFGFKRGELRKYADGHTNEHQIANQSNQKSVQDRRNGTNGDLIVWYEAYSKDGIGVRHRDSDEDQELSEAMDEIVGDFAYICFAEGIPFLLNAAPNKLLKIKNDDDAILESLSWPVPSYIENRWPVDRLAFNIDTESAYPIPPLGEAMGELITLNILVSCYLEQAYSSRKSIIAYLESQAKDVERALSENTKNGISLLKLKDGVHKSVNEVVQYLNRPGMNTDLLGAIQYVSELFNQRSGLNELMYGMSSTQSRSATDAQEKASRSQVRPDKMAEDVAKWMTEVMDQLKFHAALVIEGKDIEPMLGVGGSYLWDKMIASEDPEVVARSMSCTVQASEVRKPDRARDMANMQQMLPMLLPILQQYAYVKGPDPSGVEPMNNLISAWGKIAEADMTGVKMGPFAPPPPDEQLAAMQQQLQQLEAQGMAADVELKQAQAAKTAAEAQGAAGDQQQRQLEFEFDAAGKQMDLQHKAASSEIDIQAAQMKAQIEQIKAQQKIGQDAAKFMFQGAQMRADLANKRAMAEIDRG